MGLKMLKNNKMETPKIKAEQLLDKYYKLFAFDLENTISEYEAIECAKIAVIEIIPLLFADYKTQGYWEEVLNELNKL